MKSRAAVLWGLGQDWKVEEIELDPPKAGEVLVEWKAAGLCHSDEHLVTGDMVVPRRGAAADRACPTFFPIIGGHEGAGVVAGGRPGRHHREAGRPRLGVASSRRAAAAATARPAARTCATSAPARFDRGQITDGTVPPPRQRRGLSPSWPSSARSPSTPWWPRQSVIKVDDDLPLDRRLPRVVRRRHRLGLGRRAGRRRRRATPSSSSASAASASNAVQGARMAGAKHVIAVDPVEFKREKAMEFGATHTVGVDGGGAPARHRAHLGPDGRQGDHDAGRDVRRADGRRP